MFAVHVRPLTLSILNFSQFCIRTHARGVAHEAANEAHDDCNDQSVEFLITNLHMTMFGTAFLPSFA